MIAPLCVYVVFALAVWITVWQEFDDGYPWPVMFVMALLWGIACPLFIAVCIARLLYINSREPR